MVYLHFPGDFYLIFQLWHLFKDLGRVAIDASGILLVGANGGGMESPSVKSCLLAWAQDRVNGPESPNHTMWYSGRTLG